jgi:hypothetical protein
VFLYSIARIELTIEHAHRATLSQRDHSAMVERTDLITASRVDLALILLPLVGWLKTSYTLAASGVPLEVAVRVMVLPQSRRPTRPAAFLA